MTDAATYLDHAATTPLLPEVRAAIVEALDLTGNPSSVHRHGRAAREVVDRARGEVARLAGADRNQVVFTGSATEAITQAIVGGVKAFAIDRVIVGAGEHQAVLKAAEASGAAVERVGLLASGVLDIAALEASLRAADDAGALALVAVQWVNNETGVVQPVSEVEALVGPGRHYLFVDAVQAAGKLELEFAARAADMMAMSAHKIGGPSGIGALLVKGHCDTVRLIPGGGQEQGRRGGTEAVALIAGFGAAANAFRQRYDAADIARRVDSVSAGLRDIAADTVFFGGEADRIGSMASFAIPGLKSSVAMMGLDLEGVSVSSGSACSSGKVGRSHVLEAMGVDAALVGCALRVSLGWSSSDDDVTEFLAAMRRVVARHRSATGQAAWSGRRKEIRTCQRSRKRSITSAISRSTSTSTALRP